MDPIEISEAGESDIEQIALLTVKYLTEGEDIAEDIRQSYKKGVYWAYKAEADGEIVGFITLKEGMSFTVPHPEIEEEILEFTGEGRIFIGDGMWVDKKMRRHGIGTRLMKVLLDSAHEHGADYLLNEYWIYPGGKSLIVPMANVFGIPVFQKIVPNFYHGMEKSGMTCPICGDDCKCSAEVVLYDLRKE